MQLNFMQQTIGIILCGLMIGALWMLIGLFLGSKLGIEDCPKNLKQLAIQTILCGPAMPIILAIMYVFDKIHIMWNQIHDLNIVKKIRDFYYR